MFIKKYYNWTIEKWKQYFSQMNLNSIFLEAIEDIIYNVQLAQEIILNIKYQYVKHDEESIMVWKAFSIQEIEYIINDIMNKKILKTHMLPYDFLKKK